MMGERLAHGTPFRCAWEDGLLDNSRVVQVFFSDLNADIEFVGAELEFVTPVTPGGSVKILPAV